MIVIREKVESVLFSKLQYCWENAPTHRCLHIKLSLMNEVSAENVEEFIDVLVYGFRSAMDDQSAELYVCCDHDVFIVARDLTHKRVDKVFAHLAPKLTPALLSPGLASLYETGVDWARLRTICEKKIEAIDVAAALARTQKKEALKKLSKKEALRAINKDLMKTLGKRRLRRENAHVMVVEDDPFSQKMVGNALKNYSVSMSGDGAGALMSYVRNAPDVLFLDIGLPDINGHEVLEKLFKIDPDAYVVMFSGNGDRENILKAVELGAKGFVGKPFTKDKLIAYIEKSPFIQQK
jgi:two-component system chemotaxis response regulator CheY